MPEWEKFLHKRSLWLSLLTGAVLLLLSWQLYRLTVIQSASWRVQAEVRMLKEMKTRGPRGSIYDSQGLPLAISEPSYSAVLLEKDRKIVEAFLPALTNVLTAHDPIAAAELAEDILARMESQGLFAYEPLTIKRKLDLQVVSEFADRKGEFPGVVLMIDGSRRYPQGALAAALLGYVGRIDADDVASGEYKDYSGNELIGRDGLEKFYEREMRGLEGKVAVVADPFGRPVSGYDFTQPLSGNNLHLTMDTKLQRFTEQYLAKQMEWIGAQNDKEAHPIHGAVVVQNVKTGAIVAMASYPTYDPNWFVTGDDRQVEKVLNDPMSPLFNWAMMRFPPGSTYKMGVGLAALEAGVLGPYQQIHCDSTYFRDRTRKNWTFYDQGMADVARSLAISCDPYFYEAGYLLGIDRLAAFMAQFGFGKETGIDLPDEAHGTNPTKESYGDGWYEGNVYSVGIGQGDVLATPLQLANYTATIAMRGTRMQPYLVQRITSATGEVVKETVPIELPPVLAKPEYWDRIQAGMRLTVTAADGTAMRAFDGFQIKVAAKTGSSETSQFYSNASTVAYAPYDDPEIAVAVYIEGGSHGSWAAPIARAVMAEYFGIEDKVPPGVPTFRPDTTTNQASDATKAD